MSRSLDWFDWMSFDEDGGITLRLPRSEMGQGVHTALAALIAEELGADWASIAVQHTALDDAFGNDRTADSDAVRTNWERLGQVGARARTALTKAAAAQWKVNPTDCHVCDGRVHHKPSGRSLSFFELGPSAKRQNLPPTVPVRSAESYSLLGQPVPRLDLPDMLDGSTRYTADLTWPGLLTATVTHAPAPGDRVALMAADEALRSPRVRQVVNLGNAVAVVADDFWHAEQARKRLAIEWQRRGDDPPPPDSDALRNQLSRLLEEPGKLILEKGQPERALSAADAQRFDYQVAMQAHATMEPGVCIAHARGSSCEVWVPTQWPWAAHRVCLQHGLSPLPRLFERLHVKAFGRASRRVSVHCMPLGSGFGRRLDHDVVREAVLTSRAADAPVKLMWSREEDMRHDCYRPPSCHRVEIALKPDGTLAAWRQRIAGTGIQEGGTALPYDCQHAAVEVHEYPIGLRTGAWRSTSHAPNAFVRESVIDELALQCGADPLQYRLSMLKANERLKDVLLAVAEMAQSSSMSGFQGMAAHASKGSYIAQVAEVSLEDERSIRVDRVCCAVDCGFVVNPDGARAQIEGAVTFAMSSLIAGITTRGGAVQQGNFNDYPIIRLHQAPVIEVRFLQSNEPPGGLGEPGVPPLAPAMANAVYRATGIRLRALPLFGNDIVLAV